MPLPPTLHSHPRPPPSQGELRAADPQQRAMPNTYLTDADIPQGACVLEVGCGTGAVTRVLAAWPGVAEAVGVDPSPAEVHGKKGLPAR
jgi:cyclopropane fatty-acyl-phospholipid synthase-like methyltransferase